MTDNFIRLPGDSTGKVLDTRSFSTGNDATTEIVHREVVNIGDPATLDAVAVVTSSEGLQVRSTLQRPVNIVSSTGIAAVVTSSYGLQVQPMNIVSIIAATSGTTIIDQWLGSTEPYVGQKLMAASLPVTIASNQGYFGVTTAAGITPVYVVTTGTTPQIAVVSTAARFLVGYSIFNTTAAMRFVKFHNLATAVTAGSTTAQLLNIAVPGSTGGGGANVTLPLPGVYFSAGLTYNITANVAATDTGAPGASDIVLNAYYV